MSTKSKSAAAAAGYSGTPLLKKLGIAGNTKVSLVNPPPDYFNLLNADIASQVVTPENADLLHLFVSSNRDFETVMKKIEPLYQANTGMIIWVSWYKKSAGIKTDITEDVIRNYALRHGLVDVKVCAVSEVWSGLKLVVPKNKR